MYAMYQGGASLAQVGVAFGVTRQSVFKVFDARGLALRAKTFLPFVVFAGEKYTPTNKGYYRCTVGRNAGEGKMLHQEVWRSVNGAIPAGYDIHHRDEDKGNNDPSNLECLPKAEHTRLYSPHNNQFCRGAKRRGFITKPCLWCGEEVKPHRNKERKEGPAAFAKRRFCTFACSRHWMKGKPRGARA
jgi:HNH endonuclease